MADKKPEREIERWVTSRGRRIPIYKGESKEDVVNRMKESFKAGAKKGKENRPETDKSVFDKHQKVKKAVEKRHRKFLNMENNPTERRKQAYIKANAEEAVAREDARKSLEKNRIEKVSFKKGAEPKKSLKTASDKPNNKSFDNLYGEAHNVAKAKLAKEYGTDDVSKIEKRAVKEGRRFNDNGEEITKKEKYTPTHYTKSELEDAQFRKDALAEMKRYERNWSFYSAKEKRNISPEGIKGLRDRIKEIENYEKHNSKANVDKDIYENARKAGKMSEQSAENLEKRRDWLMTQNPTPENAAEYMAINKELKSRNRVDEEALRNYGYDPRDSTGDPTVINADGKSYYKIGADKWKEHSSSGRVLSSSISSKQLADKLENAKDVKVMPSEKNKSWQDKDEEVKAKQIANSEKQKAERNKWKAPSKNKLIYDSPMYEDVHGNLGKRGKKYTEAEIEEHFKKFGFGEDGDDNWDEWVKDAELKETANMSPRIKKSNIAKQKSLKNNSASQIDKNSGTIAKGVKITDKFSPELQKRLKDLEMGDEPVGKFWDKDNELSELYEQMRNDKNFEFSKASQNVFHQYYRYYNDGDLPGFAKRYENGYSKDVSRREKDYKGNYKMRWYRELNEAGELELERKANQAVIKELKRYRKRK